jgi:hypothetical protein
MKKMWKNKKGILGIGEIGNAIRSVIDVMPNWLKFLIFLFILAFVGYILTFAFNVFGIYCNSASEPVTIPNAITNLNLIFEKPDASQIKSTSISPDSVLFVEDCAEFVEDGSFRFDNPDEIGDLTGLNPDSPDGTTYQITSPLYLYKGVGCVSCRSGVYKPNNTAKLSYKACFGNVQRVSDEDKTFTQKITCAFTCQPPPLYEYDFTANKYNCIDQTCLSKTIGERWDELLKEKQATLLYPDSANGRRIDSTGFIGITCNQLDPKLAIFGFDFLNYKIILMLLVLWALIWLKMNIT